jgi:hypothetical protein
MRKPFSPLTEADAERIVKGVLDQLTERVYFVGQDRHVVELNFQAVMAELSDNPQFREAWLLLGQAAVGG